MDVSKSALAFVKGGFAHSSILLGNMSPFFSRAYPYKLRLSMLTADKYAGIDLSIGLGFICKCVDVSKGAPAFVSGGFAQMPILLGNMSPFFSRTNPYEMRLSMLSTVKHVGIDFSIGLGFI